VFHVVLVEPEIPANTGNIARLCAATKSLLHLVHPLGFKLEDTALKRAGMDYLDIAVMREHQNMNEALKGAGSVYYFSTKVSRPYWKTEFQPGDYFVFGRESKGLPEELLKINESKCLTIPMFDPGVRSLNLATSVSVVLYEALRQNQTDLTQCNHLP
jgi:tRNA (cytidine/uridine-2'-O-)-methyltransferase